MVIKYLLKVAIYANKKKPGSFKLKSILEWIQEEEAERKIKVDALSLDSIHMLCLLNKHTEFEKIINNFFDFGECVYTIADIYSLIIESWETLVSEQDTYDALIQIISDVPDFEDRIEQIYELIDVIDEVIINS